MPKRPSKRPNKIRIVEINEVPQAENPVVKLRENEDSQLLGHVDRSVMDSLLSLIESIPRRVRGDS